MMIKIIRFFIGILLLSIELIILLSVFVWPDISIQTQALDYGKTGNYGFNNAQYNAGLHLDITEEGLLIQGLWFPGGIGSGVYKGRNVIVNDKGVARYPVETGDSLLGTYGNHMYYYEVDYYGCKYTKFFSKDLDSCEEHILYEGRCSSIYQTILLKDSDVYIAIKEGDEYYYLKIQDGEMIEKTTDFPGYVLGDYTYYLEPNPCDLLSELYRKKKNNEAERLTLIKGGSSSSYRFLVPVEGGLLFFSPGDKRCDEGSRVYYIHDNDEPLCIFEIDCFGCMTAVTSIGNNVFVSVERFSGYDAHEMKYMKYENDLVEGTYRINLNDFSIKKINDQVFRGLFTFDDLSIYACDNCRNLVRIDSEGNIVEQIVTVDRKVE